METGSANSYKNLMTGDADIVYRSREMTEEE
jgi:hypothetical protein